MKISILPVILSYLIGSISFGYIIGKWLKGVDIREYGSGSSGATNSLRILGAKPALIIFLLDMGKGVLSVYLARWLSPGELLIVTFSATAAVAGHNWPLFFNFRGGRGIATSLGLLLTIAPLQTAIVFISMIGLIILTRYVSLGSILGTLLMSLVLLFGDFPPEYGFLGVMLAAMILYRHRMNIDRLIKGTESKLGEKPCLSRRKQG